MFWAVGLFVYGVAFAWGYGMGRDRGFIEGRDSRPRRPVLREVEGEPPIVEWV